MVYGLSSPDHHLVWFMAGLEKRWEGLEKSGKTLRKKNTSPPPKTRSELLLGLVGPRCHPMDHDLLECPGPGLVPRKDDSPGDD